MRGFALNSISRVLVIVFQLANVKLYTNYLGAEHLGIYFFLLAVSYSANALLFVPVDYYQQANLAKVIAVSGGARSLLEFNGRLAGLYLFLSLCIVLICVAIKPDYAVYASLVVVLAFALYVVQALRNTLNNLEYRNCVSVSFIQEAVVKVFAFLVLVKFFEADEVLLIDAWLIALAVSGSYLFYMTYRHRIFHPASVEKINAKDVFIFSYPFSIGAVCNWLQLQGYRLVLVPLGFAAEVGVFATLSSIGSAAIGAVSLIYTQQFTPLLYKTAGQYTTKYLKGAVAVLVSVAIVSFVVGEFVVSLLTRPEFVPHWELLLFGVLADGANLFIGALAIHVTLKDDTRKLIYSSVLGLVLMAVCLGILYWTTTISISTIGVPLLFSQWVVVACMCLMYKK